MISPQLRCHCGLRPCAAPWRGIETAWCCRARSGDISGVVLRHATYDRSAEKSISIVIIIIIIIIVTIIIIIIITMIIIIIPTLHYSPIPSLRTHTTTPHYYYVFLLQ